MIDFDLDTLDFSRSGGLVIVVAQDSVSGTVLMVAHADRDAMTMTIRTGEMHYTSRTRGLWHKGATSGNTQRVISLSRDCDGDSVLARVVSPGPACHTMSRSCFGVDALAADSMSALDRTIADRAIDSAAVDGGSSYTKRLLMDRNLRLKKIGEEAAEFVTACADGDADRATEEGADLIYHLMVALRAGGSGLDDVRKVLDKRAR